MGRKQPVSFSQKFPKADPLAIQLLERMLAFDPKDRITAEQALAHPYFKGLSKIEREPSCQPISKHEFEFETRVVTKDEVRDLIYREILEYHPKLRYEYLNGSKGTTFLYPRSVECVDRLLLTLSSSHNLCLNAAYVIIPCFEF